MHTVVLTGELDRASAPALEAEIERVCALGIDAVALDLNGLSRIDAIGIAVIAHRRSWCARRGCELSLHADTPLARRALVQAGTVEQALANERATIPTARRVGRALSAAN
jgi:anti-anti-sigma factor